MSKFRQVLQVFGEPNKKPYRCQNLEHEPEWYSKYIPDMIYICLESLSQKHELIAPKLCHHQFFMLASS